LNNKPSPTPKPCPWCGTDPIVFTSDDDMFFVGCNNTDDKCTVVTSTRGHYNDRDAAVRAWNTRHIGIILQR